MTGKHASAEERLWRNCIPEPNSGCWIWLGALGWRGYGLDASVVCRIRRGKMWKHV